MGGPFHYREKVRRRYRQHAKKNIEWAEKCEAEGTKAWAAALSRRLAALELSQAHAKRRKKTKSKNPT